MRSFSIFSAVVREAPHNCKFPKKVSVCDERSFIEAVSNDYTSVQFEDFYRLSSKFQKSDCVVVDVDNSHSDQSEEWLNAESIKDIFPNVEFCVHYSRNHLKDKGGKIARPRFHVFFPISPIETYEDYRTLSLEISKYLKGLDEKANGLFLFGTENPQVKIFEGKRTITDFFAELIPAEISPSENEDKKDIVSAVFKPVKVQSALRTIHEGERNSTLHKIALGIIKRYGDTEEAYNNFIKNADRCSPPLDQKELGNIWKSASNFFHEIIEQQEDYISPEEYNKKFQKFFLKLMPKDFTNVGQSNVFVREYGEIVKYSTATGFLVYNGIFWDCSDMKVRGFAQELTARQLNESGRIMRYLEWFMEQEGVSVSDLKKAKGVLDGKHAKVLELYQKAVEYFNHVRLHRSSKYVTAVLSEIKPKLEINISCLDNDAFLLNTPLSTYDLRLGLQGKKEHDLNDYITHQTAVEPSDKGMDIWLEALKVFFKCDTEEQTQELIDYVQELLGLAAIGRVYFEGIILAFGTGANGKSSFFNSVSKVLGSYAGMLSSDVFAVGCRRNVKYEYGELRGKRFLLAAELEEGMKLNTSVVKQLCSTDKIYAERKYRDPFSFTPTHTLFLHTNHMFRVDALDKGTWRRIQIIPFRNEISKDADIKNYSTYLVEKSGEAILSWIIEGAKKIIAKNFELTTPFVVEQAVNSYKRDNDWLTPFIEKRCEFGANYEVKTKELYDVYREYCTSEDEILHTKSEFFSGLEMLNFHRHRNKNGAFFRGLRAKHF